LVRNEIRELLINDAFSTLDSPLAAQIQSTRIGVSVTSNFGRKLTRLLMPMLLPKPKISAGITIETPKLPQGPKLRIYTPEGDGPFASMW
jgi:hypothetical protein